MFSLNRSIPFIVKAPHVSRKRANIRHNSIDLAHLFHISITGIINKHDFEEFLFDNAVDIFAAGFDLFKVMPIDDTCYTDME
jgi:hypothetical protein